MAAAGNDHDFYFCSPYAQQKYSNVSCFWETQPLGCVRISCAFHHSKPRNINGLFLPPSNTSLRSQENILLPIHPPLIIKLSDEEDGDDGEEDDEEDENYVSWVPKTEADIEEEQAIKEICYKSGEHYKIEYPHEHQSKRLSSPVENKLLPLEATKQDLQKGDDNTIVTTFNNTKKEGEHSGNKVPTESIPRTDRRSFENGETNHIELVKDHHYKEVKKKKRISEEQRHSPNRVTGKGIHTSDPKVKTSYQQRGQSKNDKTAPPYVKETGRKTYFSSSEPQRSAYVVYCTVTVTQEPKINGSTDKYNSGSYNAPTWRKRNPHANTFSKFKATIQ
ncbi:PREDICTED: uncharacterized protein C12orf50 homolog, partial [Leptosomus discolor]|uniref:uncharacterized protein C12orf50 homolog n=1 Tax=Leptosomus discolor TaxID=188344 RepID=UPI000522A6A0